jgi:hypothetical protein
MMRQYLLFSICLLLGIAANANAEIIGAWDATTNGNYTIYTLNVAPTAGEDIGGFDIKVSYSASSAFKYTSGLVFSSDATDLKTHFLLDSSTTDDDTSATTYNLAVAASAVSGKLLSGGFAADAGGAYDGGWTSAVKLLQVVVLTSSGITSNDFTIGNTNDSLAVAYVTVGDTAVKETISFASVPEPATISLLVAGLFGLLAYAWRKRK